MTDKEKIEILRDAFIKSDDCVLCGSQRCDRSPEWMEGCNRWHMFKNEYILPVGKGVVPQ